MLKRIALKDFKSFADQSVELAPLTIVVGANASGKSNLLDAIRFLQGTAFDYTFTDVLKGKWEGGHPIWPGVRGGISEVFRANAKSGFTIETDWSSGEYSCVHSISCINELSKLRLKKESLNYSENADTKELFFTRVPDSEAHNSLLLIVRDTDEKMKIEGTIPYLSSALGRVHTLNDPPESDVHSFALLMASYVRSSLRKSLFLDINPQVMRDYCHPAEAELGNDGHNISAKLFHLCQNGEKEDLIDWVSELCAPQITDIDFIHTGLDEVLFQLVEEDGTKVSARSISDGTLRFLGHIVAILTAPEDSLVLIEEIENGLHPARIHVLVEFLEGMASSRGVQIIATTHSGKVLEALSEETLNASIVCGRLPDTPGTVMKRILDIPHFSDVVAERGIDDLFTTKWLEFAL